MLVAWLSIECRAFVRRARFSVKQFLNVIWSKLSEEIEISERTAPVTAAAW